MSCLGIPAINQPSNSIWRSLFQIVRCIGPSTVRNEGLVAAHSHRSFAPKRDACLEGVGSLFLIFIFSKSKETEHGKDKKRILHNQS